jgi:hypothetical protein
MTMTEQIKSDEALEFVIEKKKLLDMAHVA